LLDFTVLLPIQKLTARTAPLSIHKLAANNCVVVDSKINSKTASLSIQKSAANCVVADF
jgi:hypothetical protein